jgi:hypothetical protein
MKNQRITINQIENNHKSNVNYQIILQDRPKKWSHHESKIQVHRLIMDIKFVNWMIIKIQN